MDEFYELKGIMINESILMNFTNSSFGNNTISESSLKDYVKPILDYLLLIILLVVMLAMGCEVTWMSIWSHVKRPTGLLIGLLSQFGSQPLCAYAVLKLSGIKGLHATGVLIIACCPGGVLSNTFTYFIEGDLGLSIAMTTASTVMAMGLMPANLWLYGRSFESEELHLPYKQMALSLISVTSPVIVGMILKWKVPNVAKWVVKVGSYSGLIIMMACIVIEIVVFPNMFDGVPLKLYVLVIILPVIGLSVGYFLAFVVRQNAPVRKTVAIECGVQNVPLALTIIAMSFPFEMQEDIILLPWLYGFFMIIGCSTMCIVYHYFKKRNGRLDENKEKEIALEESIEAKEALMAVHGVKVIVETIKRNSLTSSSRKNSTAV